MQTFLKLLSKNKRPENSASYFWKKKNKLVNSNCDLWNKRIPKILWLAIYYLSGFAFLLQVFFHCCCFSWLHFFFRIFVILSELWATFQENQKCFGKFVGSYSWLQFFVGIRRPPRQPQNLVWIHFLQEMKRPKIENWPKIWNHLQAFFDSLSEVDPCLCTAIKKVREQPQSPCLSSDVTHRKRAHLAKPARPHNSLPEQLASNDLKSATKLPFISELWKFTPGDCKVSQSV